MPAPKIARPSFTAIAQKAKAARTKADTSFNFGANVSRGGGKRRSRKGGGS